MFNKIIISVGIMFMLICMAGCGGGSGPEATVKQFARAIEKGETEKAMDLMSAKELEGMDSDEKTKVRALLGAMTGEIEKKGGIKSIEIDDVKMEDDTAEVTATTTYGNGESETGTTKLVKEDGKWKISSLSDK